MPPVCGSPSRGRALVACALVALGGCARPEEPHRAAAVVVASPLATAQPLVASVATPSAVPRPKATAKAAVKRVAATANAVATAAPPVAPTPVAPTPAAGVSAAAVAPVASIAPSAAPSAAPTGTQILSVRTAPDVVHAGESVRWDVRTSPDIVSVTAHVSAYTIPLQRTGPGRFGLNFAIPASVPAFFHGTYNLEVVGATSAGGTAKRNVSMTFR
ncbi:MAG: hypothetical protein NVSMB21_17760 [Vulcanimicrobiaceae bacterium]